MVVVWAVLWLAALLLLLVNRRSPVFRWLGLVAFSGGSGALASVMDGWITAYDADPSSYDTAEMLRHIQRLCSWTSYYGLPYGYLLFAVSYHGNALPVKLGKWMPWAALIPVLIMLALPIDGGYPVAYLPLGCWAIPYMLIGTGLIVTKRAGHPAEWKAHLTVTAAVVPAVLFALAMNYTMPLFGVYRLWQYNVWSIPIAFLIFIIALFKYGFLGVQLMIERRKLDYSMRAITSGTAMLNHAIKNDIAKIKLFADKISRSSGDESGGMQADTAVITRSVEHIEAMIRSVHERTQELVLRAERIDLAQLVRAQAAVIQPAAEATGVAVVLNAGDTAAIEVLADAAQTQEALHNVINNALEAMPRGGELTISLTGGKRGSIIEIRDTGCGIEKHHLHKVTEPFFTTKSGKSMNFGLGLAYCSQLMSRQGGELRIRSELGQGTVVTLVFPAPRRNAVRTKGQGVGIDGSKATGDTRYARRG
ncbi:sensor histidine kinase [Paenibacillus kobensis]|uniref:sensor histidine kinase n=1 Tax=Paenibacillus kobensis TaxID=59841 RepID=UPI000FD96FA2|nr:HAMP domain-containing sensor histidine kinase [Paenibacillus kobensis]